MQQQSDERSPLLPTAATPAAHAPLAVPTTSFLDVSGSASRQRKKARNSQRLRPAVANEDNNREGDEGSDSEGRPLAFHATDGHEAEDGDYDGAKSARVWRETSLPLPTGLAKRKPRWSGLRNKLTSMSTGQDVLPRVTGRRNRHRPSNLRGDGEDGVFYYDAVVTDRTSREPPTDAPKARIAAYCTCDKIALFKLLKWLDRPTREGAARGWANKMYMGVVHSSLRVEPDADAAGAWNAREREEGTGAEPQQKDAFYFATGCCVFWGLTREEELVLLQALAPFSTGPVAQIEAEDMLFCYGDSSRVANDEITLSSSAVAEKLAISFAMSQSAKLDVFEERVEDRIKNTKHIPSSLATHGSIQYTKKDISKLIGQLFIELADVNLHSEILDEPDFFWEDDEYEPLYKRMVKYLDVNNRVKILNKRLDILRELVEVLNQELTRQHGTKLEWIIIWLLVVEVVIAVVWEITVKDLLGFFRH